MLAIELRDIAGLFGCAAFAGIIRACTRLHVFVEPNSRKLGEHIGHVSGDSRQLAFQRLVSFAVARSDICARRFR